MNRPTRSIAVPMSSESVAGRAVPGSALVEAFGSTVAVGASALPDLDHLDETGRGRPTDQKAHRLVRRARHGRGQEPEIAQVDMHVGLADHLCAVAEIEPAAGDVLAFEDDLVARVEDLLAQVEKDLVARHARPAQPPGLPDHPARDRLCRHRAFLVPGADRHVVRAVQLELFPGQRRPVRQPHLRRIRRQRGDHREKGDKGAKRCRSMCVLHGTCQCVLHFRRHGRAGFVGKNTLFPRRKKACSVPVRGPRAPKRPGRPLSGVTSPLPTGRFAAPTRSGRGVRVNPVVIVSHPGHPEIGVERVGRVVALRDHHPEHLRPVAKRPFRRRPDHQPADALTPHLGLHEQRMHHRHAIVDPGEGGPRRMIAAARQQRRLLATGAFHHRLAGIADAAVRPDVADEFERRPHRIRGRARDRRFGELGGGDGPEVDRIAQRIAMRLEQRIEPVVALADLEQRHLSERLHRPVRRRADRRPLPARPRSPPRRGCRRPYPRGWSRPPALCCEAGGQVASHTSASFSAPGRGMRFGHAVDSGNSLPSSTIAADTDAPSVPRTTMLAPKTPPRLNG